MKLSNLYSRNDWIPLPVASGWLVAKNELYVEKRECLDTMYSATNLMNGRSVELGCSDETDSFHVLLTQRPSTGSGGEIAGLGEERVLYRGPEFSSALAELRSILVDSEEPLIQLQVPVWWYVRVNHLRDPMPEIDIAERVQLLFEGYSLYDRPYHLAVRLCSREDNPYRIDYSQASSKAPKTKINHFELGTPQAQNHRYCSSLRQVCSNIQSFMYDQEELDGNNQL